MYAVDLENLSKSYDDVVVLRNLNLRIAEGEVYGLLGPNGAGKSTLIHLLMGFLRPSSGRLRVLGSSKPDQIRRRLGYLPERLRYHTRYSAREYLRFLGKFSDMDDRTLAERINEELVRVGLGDVADRTLATFSKGMLQRLGIAQALLNSPNLLLIDEPTSGLDPAGQREVLDVLAELRTRGQTIVLCTHYLDEIEYLCDRVGVLAGGKIAAEAEVAQFRMPGTSIIIEVDDLAPELQVQLKAISAAVQCDSHTIIVRPNNQPLQVAVLQFLLAKGVAVLTLQPLESPLERLYLQAVRGASPEPETLPPVTLAQASEIVRELRETAPGPRRTNQGDTLLRELLRRDGRTGTNSNTLSKDEEASSND